jgi:hypothetical protein
MRVQTLRSFLADLYRLSFKIRNTTWRGGESKALAFKPIDEETGINIFSVFEELDRRHVGEHLSSIQKAEGLQNDLSIEGEVGQTVNVNWPALDEHTVELLGKHVVTTFPKLENNWFARRLALANTHRRQYFAYWRRHVLKLSYDHQLLTGFKSPDASKGGLSRVALPTGRLLPVPTKPGLSPFDQVASTIISGTEATRFDPKNEDRLDTETVISYATTAYGLEGDAVILPPPPPDAATQPEFRCQICHVVCPSKQGRGKEWR